jgi:hypothetical protein
MDWEHEKPKPINLTDWLGKWIPGIIADKRKIAIFPLANDRGMVVDPDRLAMDLREAMAEYE